MFYMEPSKNRKFNSSFAKNVSGSDQMMSGRDLFKNERPIKVDGKVMIAANNSFNVGIIDKALKSRLCVIPFMSEFVQNPEVIQRNKKYVHKMDVSLMDNFRELSTSLARILLLSFFRIYKEEGLVKPRKISSATKDFIHKGDPVYRFMHECTTYDTTTKGDTTSDVLYNHYINWYSKYYPGKKSMDLVEFKSELDAKGYKINAKDIVVGVIELDNF
ncbi:hypothetical protein OSTOST_10062 [Ostertagia ostertagi]